MSDRERKLTFGLIAAVGLGAALVVWNPLGKGGATGPGTVQVDPAASEMNAGLELQARDPAAAAEHFRKALLVNPNHYGATFQLARSLDLAGKANDARPYWEKMVKLADGINDKAVGDMARARLAGGSTQLTGAESDEDLMKLGIDALYTKRDPINAATLFKKVLARTPDHYGANFQLAMALDQSNTPAEARAQWDRVLRMATALNDAKAAEDATRRIAELEKAGYRLTTQPTQPASQQQQQPPPADPELDGLMKSGVDALYSKRDAAAAIGEFKKVLAKNPEHYGANYQLAMALDAAGKGDDARAQWEKVLKMAEQFGDTKAADDARARLAKK